ncbi:hypothetical protein GC105_15810 [Alkalibaculum sp. M08DMB]|uniref:Energy-coupling factor transporter transmembrane protein EcfT n=1 Tax=Alkalibaculum sporogenes TaxID=2655001 RepID=A0A6A7KCR1_9FIRM|nr:energy-coupling factor transporter transmembrane component T [Alkalibaculum sporogenes]MPW27234.1 hypothetical protein [Alkalibaculum sporogenes]
MKNIFSIYHPLVIFTYIVSALAFAMLTFNPVYVILSFYIGSLYSIYLLGIKKYISTLKFGVVLFIVVAIANPMFNHQGLTVLFYNPWDNPITLEAFAYGLSSGGMLVSIFIWFNCYNGLINNDKFMYLFGRILPTIALMLSMIMKWVPVTKNRISIINNSQKSLGLGVNMGTKKQKINRCIRVTSILMSWSLEDSIETADSMKARGYGCTKRTSYSVYKWGTHDIISMFIISLLVIVNGVLILGGYSTYEYYPTFSGNLFGVANLFAYGLYIILLAYPLLLEGKEEIVWKLLKYRT